MNLSLTTFRHDVELGEQRALFLECFPENAGRAPSQREHYYWKFQQYPAKPHSFEFIARDEAGIVGYYAALPFSYAVDGTPLRCGMVCDVMTAARMRGKGVFVKLGAFSLENLKQAGVDFLTGYPIRPEVIPGHLKVGWSIAFQLPMYLLPLKSGALLRARKLGILTPYVNLFLRFLAFALTLVRTKPVEISTRDFSLQEFFEKYDYDVFAKQWQEGRKIALLKTVEFLKWRLSAPETEYRVVCAFRGQNLSAISIVRSCELQGVPSLAVLDLMAIEEEQKCANALSVVWKQLALQNGSEVIVTMMSELHAQNLRLWTLGFLKTPAVFSLIVKCLSERAKKSLALTADHWHLMWIDSDDL